MANEAPLSFNTNWSSDSGGATDTQQLPGGSSNIIFSATGASNLNTSLTLEQFKAITPEQLIGTDPRQRALIAQYANIDGASRM